jgi:anti-sigma B factor antagonist
MDSIESSGEAPLTVDVTQDGRRVVVAVSGELDLSNVDSLRKRLDDALLSRPAELVFDLSNLTYVDSTGVGLLLRASSTVERFHIRRPSNIVRQVVKYMGLTGVLSMDP